MITIWGNSKLDQMKVHLSAIELEVKDTSAKTKDRIIQWNALMLG